VRLLGAYYVTCTDFVKNEAGEVTEIHCTYDPESRGGSTPDGRRVRGTIHWVSAVHAVEAEVRLYETLFTQPDPEDTPEGEDFIIHLNPNSLQVIDNAKLEPVWLRRVWVTNSSLCARVILPLTPTPRQNAGF
jgi:glutaminyl-tRNA synthetase